MQLMSQKSRFYTPRENKVILYCKVDMEFSTCIMLSSRAVRTKELMSLCKCSLRRTEEVQFTLRSTCKCVCLYIEPVSRSKDYVWSQIKIGFVVCLYTPVSSSVSEMEGNMPLGASFFDDVPLVEFIYLVFTRTPGGLCMYPKVNVIRFNR